MTGKIRLAFLFLILVRLLPLPSLFGDPAPHGIGVSFAGPDEWVHYHRARTFAESGAGAWGAGEIPSVDRAFAAPEGLALHWPKTYDACLGLLLRAAGGKAAAGGAPSGGARALVFVPLLGALAAGWGAARGARRLGLDEAGAVAAWAVLPASLFLTTAGAIDHHAFEIAFFWLPPLLLRRRPILAGAILGISYHVTPSAPFAAAAFLLAAFARPVPSEEIENATLSAVVVGFPAGLVRAAFDAPSLLAFVILAGMGILAAARAGGRSARGDFWTAGILLFSAVLPAWGLFAEGGGYLARSNSWLHGVAEARPLLTSDWRSFFQAVALLSPGLLALPLLFRRMPREILLPTLLALVLALLQIRFVALLSLPAAWGLLLLLRRVGGLSLAVRRPAVRILLCATMFLPMLHPVIETTCLAPGIPEETYRLLVRTPAHVPPDSILLARWDLAPYAVSFARARTVADGFHRNTEGRVFLRDVLLAPPERGPVLLDKRGVRAVLLTDPMDGFLSSLADVAPGAEGEKFWRETFALRLYRGEVPGWRLADSEGAARLFVIER